MEDADTVHSDLVAIAQMVLEQASAGTRIRQDDAVYLAELFQQLDDIMRLGDQTPEIWEA